MLLLLLNMRACTLCCLFFCIVHEFFDRFVLRFNASLVLYCACMIHYTVVLCLNASFVFALQRNQFNFTERAAQTYVNPLKTRVISTLPPETGRASGLMTQWALYDA